MANLVLVNMKLDNAGINAALLKLSQNTKRLPDDLANYACNAISYKAWQRMPKVDPWAVNQELEVQTSGVTKTGKLSKAKKPKLIAVESHSSSLGQRIVLASLHPNSRYNLKTGGVFMRSRPSTSGSAAFWAWVAQATARMVKARRSSTGFFKACARAVNVGFGIALGKVEGTILAPQGRGLGSDINKVTKLLSKGLAKVTPAQNGNGRAMFAVSATEPDTKGGQGALERIAQPVWQQAIDDEAKHIEQRVSAAYHRQIERAGIKVS